MLYIYYILLLLPSKTITHKTISIAIFIPPLGVFLERGCGADFFINILLTILGYIPGIIHALYIILKVSLYSELPPSPFLISSPLVLASL